MEWFKHSTGSHDDPDISDAIDQFGLDAYAVFFITLEIYGTEFNHLDPDGWLNISRTFVQRKLRKSSAKVEQILNFYSIRQRINFKTEGKRIFIQCPKFIEISSNWTKRKPTIKHRPPTEAPTEAPTAKEEKKKRIEENIPPIVPHKGGRPTVTYTKDFLSFWTAYPKKVGKDAAWRAWKNRNGSRPPIEEILKAIETQKQADQWTRDNGQYIPNPSTWINQGRWGDEINQQSEKWNTENW